MQQRIRPAGLSGNCEQTLKASEKRDRFPVRAQAVPDGELIVPVYSLGPVFVREINLPPSGGSRTRTKSPTIVSVKREYSQDWLETFGNLAAENGASGVWRPLASA